MSHVHLGDGRLVAELSVQWSDGERELLLPPFPVNRRSQLAGSRNMWKINIPALKGRISTLLNKNGHYNRRVPTSFTLKATFSSGGISKESELVLLPLDASANNRPDASTKETPHPNLQLTTSTKHPKVIAWS